MSDLSDTQHKVLILTAVVSCTLSVLGSLTVMSLIRSNPNARFYHRIVFGMSAADIVFSISFLLQQFLRPTYLEIPWAIGNVATCTVVGAIQLASANTVSFYNAFLSLQTFLMVVRGTTEDDITKGMLGKWGHLVSWAFPLIYILPAAVLRSINPAELTRICLIDPYPPGCDNNEEIECTRGEASGILSMAYLVGLYIPAILGFVLTCRVFSFVRRTMTRSSRYAFENQVNGREQDQRRSTARSSNANSSYLREVRVQTILYSLAYFNTILWPTLANIMAAVGVDRAWMGLRVCGWTFFGLHGVLNVMVYLRPVVSRWRKTCPELSFWQILGNILSGKQAPSRRASSSMFTNPRNQSHLSKSSTKQSRENSADESNTVEKAIEQRADENGS